MDLKKYFSRVFTGWYNEEERKYIQMRLPVKKITPEFEKNLKEKIEHNIIKADVREATKNDIECLIDLHDKAWHSTPMPFRPLKKDSIEKMLQDPNIIFLIANINGEDRGFALIYFTGKGNELNIGVIAGMGIIPEYHRKGIGTILGMATWEYFKKKGVHELRCKVYEENKISYNFIKGLGFEEYEEDFVQWKVF